MHYIYKPLKDFLSPYSAKAPTEEQLSVFKSYLKKFWENLAQGENEEYQKNEISWLLKSSFAYRCNTNKRVDLAIYIDECVEVIFEVKALKNKNEFPKSQESLSSKAFAESILYFLRQRFSEKNNNLKNIVLCTAKDFYLIDAKEYERLFSNCKPLIKAYKNCDHNQGTNTTTRHFYQETQEILDNLEENITYTHFSLENPSQEILPLIYQALSPQVLLKQRAFIDANTLNKNFYNEWLYILGLQEQKEGGKVLITQSSTPNSLSNLINLPPEEMFALLITWNNRLLFLRLLDSMLTSFNHSPQEGENKGVRFFSSEFISSSHDLQELFFKVLAKKKSQRDKTIKSIFASIPYLNSSLFDPIPLESTRPIFSLPLHEEIALYPSSILKSQESYRSKTHAPLLQYLLDFLQTYDFTTTTKDIASGIKTNHDKLINSAVLGLVFEKLNGYKEGSFYTPSFITSFMCKKSITDSVVQKFNSTYNWNCQNLNDIKTYARQDKISPQELYSTLLLLRICDPSVGSGHFLVSALNEIILIAYELGIIQSIPLNSSLEIQNDEILIYTQGKVFEYTKPTSPNEPNHQIQKELFELKKSIIENCLFGVDINPNSCEITKLRLWIELLKYSHYLFEDQNNTGELETLPNIDINIKCGNSLISYFGLDDSFSHIKNIKEQINQYKHLVKCYKEGIYESKSKIDEQIQRLLQSFQNFCFSQKYENEIKAFTNLCEEYGKNYGDYLANEDVELSKYVRAGLFTFEFDKTKAHKDFLILKETYNKIFSLEINKPFEWRFAFPEVLDDEGNFLGFDLVIGNPPYIRIQGLDKETSNRYKKIFYSAKGSYDIYVLFVEQCLKLITPKGEIGFIMPHKWLNSTFGEGLRILTKDKISKIISFGEFQIFEASTYTALQWFCQQSKNLHYLALPANTQDSNQVSEFLRSISQTDFLTISNNTLSSSEWNFGDKNSSSIQQKNFRHSKVGDIFEKIFQGIATSKDSVYFLYNCTIQGELTKGYSKELDDFVLIESVLLKPLLMGDSFHRYDKLESNLRVLFPYFKDKDSKGKDKMSLLDEKTLKTNFPKGYEYLKKCEEVLRGRENGRLANDDLWWRYIYPKNQLLFDKEKLLCPDICDNPHFTLDSQGDYYFTTTIYGYIKNQTYQHLNYLYLMAILNSKLAWYFLTKTSSVMRGGYYRIKPAYIQSFCIPDISQEKQQPFISLAKEILALKDSNPHQDTTNLESEIDNLVYSLYNLTPEEIAIIEGEK